MKKPLILFCLCALMGAGVACDDCSEPESPIDNAPFTEYDIQGKWINLEEPSDKGEILIIDNEETLRGHVDGDYPPVDFSKKTLLLAYGLEANLNNLIRVDWKQLSERSYEMTIFFQPSPLPANSKWQIAIVVDKLKENSTIKFTKEYI
jgi:hypothetical protein